jgi:ketosteroid isomerase-like protein
MSKRFLLAAWMLATGSGALAAETPVATAATLHAAMSAGDASRVEALLDPEVLILEGGGAERSRKEYAAHHLGADLALMKAANYKLEHQTSDTVGDLAWVASEALLTGNRDGKPINLRMTETLVMKRGAEGWKITHIHWSSRSLAKTP